MNNTTPAAEPIRLLLNAEFELSELLVDDAGDVVAEAPAEPEPDAVAEGAIDESWMEDTGSPEVMQAFVNSMSEGSVSHRQVTQEYGAYGQQCPVFSTARRHLPRRRPSSCRSRQFDVRRRCCRDRTVPDMTGDGTVRQMIRVSDNGGMNQD